MIRPAAFFLLAIIVPNLALGFAAPSARSAQGLAVSPFGWPSLVVVQCLAAVPLAAVVAGWFTARVRLRTTLPAAVAGILVAVTGSFTIGWVGDGLDRAEAGFLVRSIVRAFFCFALALPWAVAARRDTPAPSWSWIQVALGVAAGGVLPGVWAEKLAAEAVQQSTGELLKGRLVRASHRLAAACDLAPDRPISKGVSTRALSDLRAQLSADVAILSKRTIHPPADSAKWPAKVEYATDLIALDRLAEAEAVLVGLGTNPAAQRLLSEVYQLQERYVESDKVLREFLAEGLPRAEKPAVRAACAEAFDALANNAAARKDYVGVEAILQEGLEKLPTDEAHFRYELGLHHKMRNRTLRAMRELTTAVEPDPKLEPVIGPMLRNLREHTPACLVAR